MAAHAVRANRARRTAWEGQANIAALCPSPVPKASLRKGFRAYRPQACASSGGRAVKSEARSCVISYELEGVVAAPPSEQPQQQRRR